MLTVSIDHASKLEKQLSTDTFFYFNQGLQLCHDTDTGNDMLMPALGYQPCWQCPDNHIQRSHTKIGEELSIESLFC